MIILLPAVLFFPFFASCTIPQDPKQECSRICADFQRLDMSAVVEKSSLYDNFETKGELGRGNSAVFMVCSTNDMYGGQGKKYAAKKLEYPAEYDYYGVRDNYEVEILIVKLLNHPNIIGFRYLFDEVDTMTQRAYWLLTEFEEGAHSLDTYCKFTEGKGQDIPEELLKRVCVDVLKGLSYLHSVNIIHRDLKPPNIIIFPSAIKIIDFGSSTLPSLTAPSDRQFRGTHLINSPEMIDDLVYTEKTDIYSFGVCIWSTQENLYPGWRSLSVYEFERKLSQTRGPWVHPTTIKDQELVDFLKRCVEHLPGRRPSAQELLNDKYLTSN